MATLPGGDVPCVLTVAGSDSSGGAGVQADLKTFCARNVYGASVVTALTAQNTVGVQAVHVPPTAFVAEQLRSVLADVPVAVVKTGMLPSAEIVRVVCDALRAHASTVQHVVVDPVMVSTSGSNLAGGAGCIDALREELLPLATVVTPNLPEAARLLARDVAREHEMREACVDLHKLGPRAVLLKGGHLAGADLATDVFYDGINFDALAKPWIRTPSTHGTGCTLASAIAAELAKGNSVIDSVRTAKEYVYSAMENAVHIGRGCGPLHHMYALGPQARSRVPK